MLPLLYCIPVRAQSIQDMKPSRLGIFKNGTCFVKREGTVTVTEKSFFIKAPEKVLTGTYWVVVGKESSIHSIIVKADTFKVQRTALSLADFLEANTGQEITLYSNNASNDLHKLSGKLLSYEPRSGLVTVSSGGKTVITAASAFSWYESATVPKSTVVADSLIAAAEIKLNTDVRTIAASTISLETGVKWYPSYQFSVVNDSVAKLDMKATIVNDETDYLGMPVDIIIGSPEMFLGTEVDPACITYINQSLLNNGFDNGRYNYFNFSGNSASVFQNTSSGETQRLNSPAELTADNTDKDGQKNGDLFYYHLGSLDLEKNSKVIVPVMSTRIVYKDIYTATIPPGSRSIMGEFSVQTNHSFIISNTSGAPFTSGTAFVLNKEGQPLAQAKLFYTSAGGSSEISLSKAVDVQIKNTEDVIRKKEKVVYGDATYTQSVVSGKITVINNKDKKIRIRVTKNLAGYFEVADNGGKEIKDNNSVQVYWEVEVNAGSKLALGYRYYTLD